MYVKSRSVICGFFVHFDIIMNIYLKLIFTYKIYSLMYLFIFMYNKVFEHLEL